jgi:hypothetical protein
MMKRYDEIYKIFKDYQKSEIEKIQQKDPKMKLAIAEDDRAYFVFRGPFTKEQAEQELLELTGKSPEEVSRRAPFHNWNEVLNKYREGDEFYYYKADARKYIPFSGMSEGYMLIRENEFLDRILTKIIIQ